MNRYVKILAGAAAIGITAVAVLAWKTRQDLLPVPETLAPADAGVRKLQVLDRFGKPLTVTYANHWNLHTTRPLHRIPLLLQQVFVASEDKRFFGHNGVDWTARLHAAVQNLAALRAVRGASTITEQVVRMWHPRPRTLWSRWLEGFEAVQLEKRFSKGQILEFYLNQVPYAAQRRGVAQAAAYYFDRDLDTLNTAETLALAVLVRAPGRLDLRRGGQAIERPLMRLAERLHQKGVFDPGELKRIRAGSLILHAPEPPIRAIHFVRHLDSRLQAASLAGIRQIRSTLDGGLQQRVQQILDQRLAAMRAYRVKNGAVLVIDHANREILAWVNGGAAEQDTPGMWIDAVTTPRQPGSTLKPFLYALALEKGWTAATLVDDRPLALPVGSGLHAYHNYSRNHYGPLRVRETLANSLNIPAVRAIQFVGVECFLQRLHRLGFLSLGRHPQYYGEGLALGNGEVTLYELVRAYAAMADRGVFEDIRTVLSADEQHGGRQQVFSPEVSSLIADILSDSQARRREFGAGSLLRFPVQTAVKTGTSNDYRDAWAVGFNDRFTVGVWTGNLDGVETEGITGSTGPALVLRSVFAELNRHRQTRPLFLSPRLIRRDICRDSGLAADGRCLSLSEWFIPGTEPRQAPVKSAANRPIRFTHPTGGLHLALDPRIPDELETIDFELSALPPGARVEWYLDDTHLATTTGPRTRWLLRRGEHSLHARVMLSRGAAVRPIPPVRFVVK